MATGELRWVRSIAFHRKPDVMIESIFIDVVRLGEIHFLQLPRPVTLFVREWRRGDRSLGQGYIVGERCVRSKVRRAGEAIEHQWRHGILLVHRRQAQDSLDGVQDAGLVIKGAHDFSSFGVRANNEAQRAVAVHMIVATLRIVFHDEDYGVGAEDALGDGLDDLPQREVIIGHLRLRCGGAAGVIVGQIKQVERGPIATGLGLV